MVSAFRTPTPTGATGTNVLTRIYNYSDDGIVVVERAKDSDSPMDGRTITVRAVTNGEEC